MRIVYYTRPSTPMGYFGLAIKSTLLAYVAILLLYFLTDFLGADKAEYFAFFNNIFGHVAQPLFRWAGLEGLSGNESGLMILFLLLFTPALLNFFPMLRLKLQQLDMLDEAYGPVKKRVHITWFVLAGAAVLGIIFIRYAPKEANDPLSLLLVDCTRLMVMLTLVMAAVGFLIVGARLQASWKKGPHAIKLPGTKSKVRGKAPHLKIAVDNSAPVKSSPAPSLLSSSNTDMGLYVALTASVIQAIGHTKALPTVDVLLAPLEMQQKAASITRSSQFGHADLKGLCEKTCLLLSAGKLKSLPDLKTALALYKRADPPALMAIANELKQQLEG